MKRLFSKMLFGISAVLMVAGFSVSVASAQPVNVYEEFNKSLKEAHLVGESAQKNDLTTQLGSIINTLLGLIGVVTFVLVIYAGSLWILAAGNEEKVEQSKRILKGCVLGLVIIFSAYILVNFTISQLGGAVTGNTPSGAEGGQQQGGN